MAFPHYSDGDSMPSRYLHPDSNGVNPTNFYGNSGGTFTRGDQRVTPSRHHTSPPSRLEYNSSNQDQAVFMSMLQSMSMSLSGIQAQLSTMDQKYERQEKQLSELKNSIKILEKQKQAVTVQPKSRKSPRGLSACVRSVHATLLEREQFKADESAKSPHNKTTIETLVNKIKGQDYPDRTKIAYAAKKYHEYLVRLQKPTSEEEKLVKERKSRVLQRRQRLHERRSRYAVGSEIKIMSLLSEKFMSDEETDPEDGTTFIKRTLSWRSPKLTKMIMKLDKRYNRNKDDSRPLKPRRNGEYSARSIPKNAPSWAIYASSTELSLPDHDLCTTSPEMGPLPVSEPENSDTSNREDQTLSSDESDDSSDEELNEWLQSATGVCGTICD